LIVDGRVQLRNRKEFQENTENSFKVSGTIQEG